MTELKNCPCCKSNNVGLLAPRWPHCRDCGLRARSIATWNTRADGWQEADAARYRWLRDHSCPPHNFYIAVPDEFHGVRYSPADVDAYIDSARKALPTPPGGDHG